METTPNNLPVKPIERHVHFRNLDALRFIAFFGVFVFHFNARIKAEYGPDAEGVFNFIFRQGYLGVNFFFVLSGFLITYLLLHEERLFGAYAVRKFWMRRILRIWPLYFAVVFYGFFVFGFLNRANPSYHETAELKWYLLFLPNFNIIHNRYPLSTSLTILWSVGIEEQFYLLWPLLLWFRKFRVPVMVMIVVHSLFFRFLYQHDHHTLLYHSFSFTGDLATGGLLAWFCYGRSLEPSAVRIPRNVTLIVYVLLAVYILSLTSLYSRFPQAHYAKNTVLSLFFSYVVFEQAFSSAPLFAFGRLKWMTALGKYTYGLYCLHPVAIMAGYHLTKKLSGDTAAGGWLWIEFVVSLTSTIVVAMLSYHLYERHFLKLKAWKFTRVATLHHPDKSEAEHAENLKESI